MDILVSKTSVQRKVGTGNYCAQYVEGDNSCAERRTKEEQLLCRRGLSRHVFNNVFVISNYQIHCWYKKRLRETSLVQEGLSRDMFYKALLYFCVKDIGTEKGWKRQLLFTREGGGGKGGGGRMMRSNVPHHALHPQQHNMPPRYNTAFSPPEVHSPNPRRSCLNKKQAHPLQHSMLPHCSTGPSPPRSTAPTLQGVC